MTPIDAGNAPHSTALRAMSTQTFDWREEAPTAELVTALQRGETAETRAFVKPIFKWMKTGVRKSGQRNDAAVEKAFAFVAWMEQLKRHGDEQLGIAPQPQLDATYALNTIVTSAQRASSRGEAERAIEMLKAFGYTPDVFAYTALIDVVARSRDVASAFERYEEMRASSSASRQNLVVFLTVIRAIGFSEEVPVATCLELMDHARRDGVFDDSLYVRTIELCAKRRDGVVATRILQQMCDAGVDWRGQQPILRALQRVLQRIDNADDVLQEWLSHSLVTETDVEAIKVATSMMLTLYTRGASALGCARHVSESARHAVMHHAIDRLLERHIQGASISTSEFETLIHQCRKRKRKDDVIVILDAMREIATNGWTIGGDAPDDERAFVPAQPQLTPNSATYAAVVETFLACNDSDQAWDAFLDATTKDFARDQLLYRKYIRGSCLLMDPTHIVELLRFAREDGIVFTARMLSDIAKMHGRDHDQGIDVVLHQIPMLTREDQHGLLQEMAASCAAIQNTDGVKSVVHAIVTQMLPRTAMTDLAVLECCLRSGDLAKAMALLRDFQTTNLLLDSPVYASLVREIFFKCTRSRAGSRDERSASSSGSSPRPALKMLHLRRAFVERLASLQQEIHSNDATLSNTTKQEAHETNNAAIEYWARHPSDHAPLMFLQHFVEATSTVVDKAQREAVAEAIEKAILSTLDPIQFVIRAVCALPAVSVSFRAQSKLAKQLLALTPLTADDIKPHHIALCLDELDSLSIHVVKELEDALELVKRPGGLNRVLSYCENALLERGNNTEKIVAFLLSRPALCSSESAAVLTPTLAQLFVLENDALVLQYFKPSWRSNQLDDATYAQELTTSRAAFIRQVIQLERESISVGGNMRCSRRAIVEFKLEHEAEFLPLLMIHTIQFTSENGPELVSSNDKSSHTAREYLELPLPLSNIILVDDDDTLQFAYEVLVYETNVSRIALDAEWRPTHGGQRSHNAAFTRCAVLQIACDSHVFLFDLLALEIEDLEELLASLFDNESILKLGFRLDGDLQRLRLSFPETTCFDADEIHNVMDLASDLPQTGLSALAERELGLPLDKSQQCSDWEQRPLTKPQIAYAALDAFCLLMLHDQMVKTLAGVTM